MGAAADFQNALGDLMSELGKEFSQDPQFNEELSKLLQTTIPPGGKCYSNENHAPPASAMGAAADFQNALGDLMSELDKEFSQDPQFNEELSKLLQTTIPPGGKWYSIENHAPLGGLGSVPQRESDL